MPLLIKPYIPKTYGLQLPHYTISIIPHPPIHHNALHYILNQHPPYHIPFIHPSTAKPPISTHLQKPLIDFQTNYAIPLSTQLPLLPDPPYSTHLYPTTDHFLIPTPSLNSTLSPLLTPTLLNNPSINPHDFHPPKYYQHLLHHDLSNLYVHTIQQPFSTLQPNLQHKP
ncbi:cysteine protease StiP domain-containing protein, partial [Bacillus pumilus]|uniref:cysteine protease StiP domain-containing protein n=1 Tax=Bacillus pumilus TaxID=1408 RepID=UPI0034D96070